jgi:hypothetical protein
MASRKTFAKRIFDAIRLDAAGEEFETEAQYARDFE